MLSQEQGLIPQSPANLAYAAGFFDGEGCIYVAKEKSWYKLRIEASQNIREPLDFLQGLFGGRVTRHKQTRGGLIYSWRLYSIQASEAIKKMLPYFRVKQHQANVAIIFQSQQSRNRKRSETQIQFQESCYLRLRKLKLA